MDETENKGLPEDVKLSPPAAGKPKRRPRVKVNVQTLPLKVTLFLYFGAMSALLPYLTVHMQDLGISIQEVAVVYAVLPFTTFAGPTIMGLVADKLGEYKWILVIVTFFNGFFHTSLLFVPQYRPEVMVTGRSVLEWDPVSSQASLVPESPVHCPAFMSFFSSTSSLQMDWPADCTLSANSSQLTSYGALSHANRTLDLSLSGPRNCSFLVSSPELGGESRALACRTSVTYLAASRPQVGNPSRTFWIYFGLRILATICMSACFSLLDATTLAIVKSVGKAEYGKERVWSVFGLALTSPIAGIIVDRVSRAKGYTDYAPAFYLSNALLLLNILAYFLIKLRIEKPEKGLMKNVLKLFKYPEVVVFLIMTFVLGTLWGFVENYLFVFLKELQAPNYLLGLTLTVGSLVGLPFLWGSERIVAKVGRVNLILIAFFMYFVRYFGYSYLQNPFWCFPFEALEAFTYHLMWTAAATYCSLLAPKGLLASMMGVMGSLHYGLGKGAGSFMGGLLYGSVGARLTFRYFGIAAGIFGVIFFVLDFFWIGKVVQRRLKEKALDEKAEEGKELQSLTSLNPVTEPRSARSQDESGSGSESEAERRRSSFMSQAPIDLS